MTSIVHGAMCVDPGNGPRALTSKECFPYRGWDFEDNQGPPVDHLSPVTRGRRHPNSFKVSLEWDFENFVGTKTWVYD
jgi:hypothetical protein